VAREKVDRDEFDALILAKLKAVHALLPRVDTDVQFWSALRPFAAKLRNQVYVDEATDFSEIQLAAMYHLSHPQVRSFFMSGDFDQRLTEWGIKDPDALQRAVPGISTRDVEIGYRQSRKLKDFVDLMRRRWLGAEPNSATPKFGLHDGFEPAMFAAKGDLDAQAGWIADRIHEVDRMNERLPSVAVLVPRTEDVKPLAKRLEELLDSIPVSAHEEAGNLGRDEEVRVFPVHHVKGLEFEAAFFVGVDQLRHDVPELFQRYLYVGSTRAATFLGFAANNKMPSEIMDLRDSFVSAWEG
jgi:superfamily I DNA/RNA helicase